MPQLGVPLAAITVSTDDGFGDLTATLREEAGKVGANAIIVVDDMRGASARPQATQARDEPSEGACQGLSVERSQGPGAAAGDAGSGILLLVALACLMADLTQVDWGQEYRAMQADSYRGMRALLVHIPPDTP